MSNNLPDNNRLPTWAYILGALIGATALILVALINRQSNFPSSTLIPPIEESATTETGKESQSTPSPQTKFIPTASVSTASSESSATSSFAPESISNNMLSPTSAERQPVEPIIRPRQDTLIEYDSIYNQEGWCGLWSHLVNDGLVSGNCPNAQHTVTETINGQTLVTAMEVTMGSPIRLNYPTCANYGTSNDLEYSDGYAEAYDNHTDLTNAFIKSSKLSFSIYFRCDNVLFIP